MHDSGDFSASVSRIASFISLLTIRPLDHSAISFLIETLSIDLERPGTPPSSRTTPSSSLSIGLLSLTSKSPRLSSPLLNRTNPSPTLTSSSLQRPCRQRIRSRRTTRSRDGRCLALPPGLCQERAMILSLEVKELLSRGALRPDLD